ncbi:MAG: TonB-dependent receptor [Verrucomicrobiota bacterium]
MIPQILRLAGLTILLVAGPGLKAQELKTFSLEAMPLSDAITEFAEQADIAVSVNPSLISGKRANALAGRMTVNAGLAILLGGTGLESSIEDGMLTVSQASGRFDERRTEGLIDLGRIVLKGELQERTLQESQTSAVVFLGDDLDEEFNVDIRDSIQRAANAGRSQQTAGGYAIRGVSSRGPGQTVSGSLLLDVNIDGASASVDEGGQRSTLPSTWDLEQIEILRGPQSTQRGKNALAGAIYIRSKDPEFYDEAKARVDFGSYNEFRQAFAGNYEFIDDKLAARISFENYSSDGAMEDLDGSEEDVGFRDSQTLRMKTRYAPSEKVDVILSHSIADSAIYGFGNGGQVQESEFPNRRVRGETINADLIETTTTSTNLRGSIEASTVCTLNR